LFPRWAQRKVDMQQQQEAWENEHYYGSTSKAAVDVLRALADPDARKIWNRAAGSGSTVWFACVTRLAPPSALRKPRCTMA
jgi:hypothetical protein